MDPSVLHSIPDGPVFIPPQWVTSMGVPVWITDPAGCVSYVNWRAEDLFGHSLDEWLGRPCHMVVPGCTRDHVCARAQTTHEIEPLTLEATTKDGSRISVRVVVIAVETSAGRLLVHLVVEDERGRRIRNFMECVMSRTSADTNSVRSRFTGTSLATSKLSPRESEVLSLLAADVTLCDIAQQLVLSHATIRNHVQHILSKLGVHSILEAVAVWLMDEQPPTFKSKGRVARGSVDVPKPDLDFD